MGQPLVSIIVPVYNTEQYLEKCLDSLTHQNLKEIQIVCVNDGSVDESSAILERYALHDSRIVIINQKNSGLSGARNTGLRAAEAPYIMFCDSDDWYEPTMCSAMLDVLLEYDVDLAVCDVNMVYTIPSELKRGEDEYYHLKYSGRMPVTFDSMINTNVSSCNKIFRRNIIDCYHIRYPEGLHYEDAYFYDAYMAVSKYIYYLNEPLYNYLRRPDSIMSETFRGSEIAADHLMIVIRFFDFLHAHSIFDDNRLYFWRRFLDYYLLSVHNSRIDAQDEITNTARKFYRRNKKAMQGVPKPLQDEILKLLFFRYRLWCGIKDRIKSRLKT